MPYIQFQNKKVHYKTIGTGRPLLLIHGNTVSSFMFKPLVKLYKNKYRLIIPDLPGHGRSERLEDFEKDFWYYNAEVCYELIKQSGIKKLIVVGSSGGALVAINLALEHPEVIENLIADSFEGEIPLESFIRSIETDREQDKKKLRAKIYWFLCHGRDWKKIVDQDTKVNLDFYKSGKSFFHKSFSELQVPVLLTGSKKDEYCSYLDRIYEELKRKHPETSFTCSIQEDIRRFSRIKKPFLRYLKACS